MPSSMEPTVHVQTVPAFLTKLWVLVGDVATNELICWDSSGRSFHVQNQTRFAREILPLYYKHNNMTSFIRQLNMYGFRKVVRGEPLNLKVDRDEVEFAHRYFIEGQEELLEQIKRRANPMMSSNGRGADDIPRTERGEEINSGVPSKNNDVNRIRVDVNCVRDECNRMKERMEVLERNYKTVTKQVGFLLEENKKQKEVMKQIITFFWSMVNPRSASGGGGGLKRKMHLMLEAGDASSSSGGRVIPPKLSRRRLGKADIKVQPLDEFDTFEHCDGEMLIQEIVDSNTTSSGSKKKRAGEATLPEEERFPLKIVSYESMLDERTLSKPSIVKVYDTNATQVITLDVAHVDDTDIAHLGDTDVTQYLESIETCDEQVSSQAMTCDVSTSERVSDDVTQGDAVSGDVSFADTLLEGEVSMDASNGSQSARPITTIALSDSLLSSDSQMADMGQKLDILQSNVGLYHDMFVCGQLNFESLLGLYDLGEPNSVDDDDDPLSSTAANSGESSRYIQGNEVIQYVPSTQADDPFELHTPCGSFLEETGPLFEREYCERGAPMSPSYYINPLLGGGASSHASQRR